MYSDIGNKIKALAKITCWIGIIFSVLVGLLFLVVSGTLGLGIMITGSLLSWVGSFFTYGFGQLIKNTERW